MSVADSNKRHSFSYVEFTEELERILGAKVDVLTPAGMAGIRNPFIAQSIRESIFYVHADEKLS
jgi:predicted nucleotidyltransferase